MAPVLISANGKVRVDASYQQFFDQYTTANIPLFDAKSRAMIAVLMGGISIDDYDYPGGPLSNLTSGGNSPGWVDDVSSLVESKNGQDQEYIMPPIPGPGYYGGNSAFFASPAVPVYSNGVIKLNKLKRPTVVGYVYGGIFSTFQQTGQHNLPDRCLEPGFPGDTYAECLRPRGQCRWASPRRRRGSTHPTRVSTITNSPCYCRS